VQPRYSEDRLGFCVNSGQPGTLLQNMSQALLELDGSYGEGGGQILRSSLALSLLTGRGFHLRNIRAGRAKPGLQPQHLQSGVAAARLGQAQLRGASRGSSDLVFEPGPVRAGSYHFDIGTAGATGLVLHTVYLPLALRGGDPSHVTLVGGTHVSNSPSFHFLAVTWRPYMEHLGLHVSLRLQRPGFYPRGGGLVEATIAPCPRLHGIHLPDRRPVRATGFSAVAGLPEHIARRQARRARFRLEQLGLDAAIEEQSWDGGPGSVIAVELDTHPVPTLFCAIGARGKPAEAVADDAVDEVAAWLAGGPMLVDPHSADQLLLPLALAEGPSEYGTTAVTLHLTTNLWVIRQFLEREVEVEGEIGRPGRVRVR
jgi:RNA 3'-phosphate cyclase